MACTRLWVQVPSAPLWNLRFLIFDFSEISNRKLKMAVNGSSRSSPQRVGKERVEAQRRRRRRAPLDKDRTRPRAASVNPIADNGVMHVRASQREVVRLLGC